MTLLFFLSFYSHHLILVWDVQCWSLFLPQPRHTNLWSCLVQNQTVWPLSHSTLCCKLQQLSNVPDIFLPSTVPERIVTKSGTLGMQSMFQLVSYCPSLLLYHIFVSMFSGCWHNPHQHIYFLFSRPPWRFSLS